MSDSTGATFALVSAAAVRDPALPLASLRLLCILGLYRGVTGRCWPSRATLAAEVGFSGPNAERSLTRAMRPLIERGYVQRVGGGAGDQVSVYDLPTHPSGEAKSAPPQGRPNRFGAAKSARKGRPNRFAGGGQTGSVGVANLAAQNVPREHTKERTKEQTPAVSDVQTDDHAADADADVTPQLSPDPEPRPAPPEQRDLVVTAPDPARVELPASAPADPARRASRAKAPTAGEKPPRVGRFKILWPDDTLDPVDWQAYLGLNLTGSDCWWKKKAMAEEWPAQFVLARQAKILEMLADEIDVPFPLGPQERGIREIYKEETMRRNRARMTPEAREAMDAMVKQAISDRMASMRADYHGVDFSHLDDQDDAA